MARHDRGGSLAERAGLHVMGEVGDHRAVHLEVDLDGRAAQFGMRRGAGIGVGEPAQAWDVPGQLDDALVVNVVQHMMQVPPDGLGGRVSCPIYGRTRTKYSPAFLRRPAAMSAPSAGDTPVLIDRSNGVDDMDGALIKPLRAGKPAEARSSELDPSEFM